MSLAQSCRPASSDRAASWSSFAPIAVWPGPPESSAQPGALGAPGAPDRACPRRLALDGDLPPIKEVDAWAAVEDLEADAAAFGGVPPWPELRAVESDDSGASRPLTVSIVAALLLFLAMIHSVGALGSLSLGLDAGGAGRAVVGGVLALLIGAGETVCAIQVTRGRAWARLAVICLGALMLLWLTMSPWSPDALTIAVFVAWLIIGALLAHPLTSRFFAAVPSPSGAPATA